ncbi:MAG: hypothetical protein J7L66_06095 [Anaerolineaceae bacterium]|nr:hypothetical protein [Anaerolineaceae bacterium]
MGAIKDCVDLFEKLDNSIKDRKTLNILFPIKEKLHLAATEQLALEREVFNTERELKDEIDQLKFEKRQLIEAHSKEVSKLQTEKQELKSELERKNKGCSNVRLVRG